MFVDAQVGMHFMNPVPAMALVELIRGMATSDEVSCLLSLPDPALQLHRRPRVLHASRSHALCHVAQTRDHCMLNCTDSHTNEL